jgi:hypothetical protein
MDTDESKLIWTPLITHFGLLQLTLTSCVGCRNGPSFVLGQFFPARGPLLISIERRFKMYGGGSENEGILICDEQQQQQKSAATTIPHMLILKTLSLSKNHVVWELMTSTSLKSDPTIIVFVASNLVFNLKTHRHVS